MLENKKYVWEKYLQYKLQTGSIFFKDMMCFLQIGKEMGSHTTEKQRAKYVTQQITKEQVQVIRKHKKSCLNSIIRNATYQIKGDW